MTSASSRFSNAFTSLLPHVRAHTGQRSTSEAFDVVVVVKGALTEAWNVLIR